MLQRTTKHWADCGQIVFISFANSIQLPEYYESHLQRTTLWCAIKQIMCEHQISNKTWWKCEQEWANWLFTFWSTWSIMMNRSGSHTSCGTSLEYRTPRGTGRQWECMLVFVLASLSSQRCCSFHLGDSTLEHTLIISSMYSRPMCTSISWVFNMWSVACTGLWNYSSMKRLGGRGEGSSERRRWGICWLRLQQVWVRVVLYSTVQLCFWFYLAVFQFTCLFKPRAAQWPSG